MQRVMLDRDRKVLFRPPITLSSPAHQPPSKPVVRAPRLDPEKEPDVNADCLEVGFRPSDAVVLSPDGMTATLDRAESQVVISKDWISKGHTCNEKSWEFSWGDGELDVTYAPWVGITAARSFDDDGFTMVFDLCGNRRWSRAPLSMSDLQTLPMTWEEVQTESIEGAYTEENKKEAKLCPGRFKVTFNMEKLVLTIQFGNSHNGDRAKTWTLRVHLGKAVGNLEWTQVRPVIWLRNSAVDAQRIIKCVQPS